MFAEARFRWPLSTEKTIKEEQRSNNMLLQADFMTVQKFHHQNNLWNFKNYRFLTFKPRPPELKPENLHI